MEVDLATGPAAPLAVEAVPNGNGDAPPRRLTAADFARPLVATEEVVIEGVGSVLVRGFTKAEQRWMQAEARGAPGPDGAEGAPDEGKLELLMLTKGLAEPQLTMEQAQQALERWDAASVEQIIAAIVRVSGMVPGFTREAVARFREGS
jgi:hypothetical protein